jgi:hypothetical protein
MDGNEMLDRIIALANGMYNQSFERRAEGH